MKNTSRMGLSAIAAISLVATTTAAEGALPRPLGAPAAPSDLATTEVTVSDRRPPTVRTGAWIAYATAAPGDDRSYYGGSGSDVFMTRLGGQPKLVAGRGSGGRIWNVCPAFSPKGTMLAFARKAPSGVTLGVVGVASDGRIGSPRISVAVPDINRGAPCPKWSADSSRLAYLDTRHKLIVRALDGSSQLRRAGDPRVRDFNRGDNPAVGPGRDLVARRETLNVRAARCGLVVSRLDGSNRRVISDQPCSYAIAGWSPDGRKLLVMRDVGGGFTMRAVSVKAPFTSTTVVTHVRVNNARSWPGYGDVSWQPIPRR